MKKIKESNTLDDMSAEHNKTFGENSCMPGDSIPPDWLRLPTGIFALDLAAAGGLPINMISVFKGPESGGKSSSAMNVMATVAQMCWRCFNIPCTCSQPSIKMRTFWADVEGTFNKEWAAAIGADPSTYIVGYGDDGEQFRDMTEAAIEATDCGLVVVDSVAALVPAQILEQSAYKQYVGIDPRFLSPFVKGVAAKLNKERKRGHPIACIMTNQIRFKIGEMFSNPEVMPGGMAFKHLAALSIRFNKRALTDAQKKFRDEKREFDRVQRHSFLIDKLKMTVYAGSGEFVRVKENIIIDDTLEYKKGEVLDYKTVIKHGKEFGLLLEESGKFKAGTVTGTQKDIIETWRKDKSAYMDFQKAIIGKARESLECPE